MSEKDFPIEIYVEIDSDTFGPLLFASGNTDGVRGGELIGVYQLQYVTRAKVTRELRPLKTRGKR